MGKIGFLIFKGKDKTEDYRLGDYSYHWIHAKSLLLALLVPQGTKARRGEQNYLGGG